MHCNILSYEFKLPSHEAILDTLKNETVKVTYISYQGSL